MSRRTAEASRAVALAWENEQQRVKEGKGTRNWTPDQQKDILERGKAYDENGRAFEGQHMKSVGKYPEYQGDPDNIQFLTREEHLVAHQGNWQNPTNWYYDPETKEITDFGDGKFIPCPVFDLSEPIIDAKSSVQDSEMSEQETVMDNKEKDPPPKEKRFAEEESKDTIPPKKSSPVKPKKSFFKRISEGIAHIKKGAWDFAVKHPFLSAVAIGTGSFAGKELIDRVISDSGSSKSFHRESQEESSGGNDGNSVDKSNSNDSRNNTDRRKRKNTSSSNDDNLDDISNDSESEEDSFDESLEDSSSNEKKTQTKRPHDTKGYTRIRLGKEEKVRGYSTGKNRVNKEDDE